MMTRYLMLLGVFILGAGVSALTRSAHTAQSLRDAVTVDPVHHHVIMENERVRVFEVMADRGDKSPMHTHPPLVLVSMSKARLKMTAPDGKTAILDLKPAQVIWMENVEHSWELLSGQVNVVAVEIKPGSAPAGTAR